MVALQEVKASNTRIHDDLPAKMVAVFVGATSGIGEYTLNAFAKHANEPRVYFVGRSQEAGDRITAECKALNPKGEFTFLKSDISLLKNVDDVCKRIKEREDKINILVLSQGTLAGGTETAEGLHNAAALVHHSRLRFALNLLPLLQKAEGPRRVLSIFAAGYEGDVDFSDFQCRNMYPLKFRAHLTSLVTLGLEALAKKAPEVGFVHDFPGFVVSGIARGTGWSIMGVMSSIASVLAPFIAIPNEESGERHLFLATSARYSGRKSGNDGVTVPESKEDKAIGTDGLPGSGVYSVNEKCDGSHEKVVKQLQKMRADGVPEKAWQVTMDDYRRILGSESL